MMSNTVPKNCVSEVHNKPDNATLTKSREKLQLIIASMAQRAHSCSWKMLDDTEDSLPAPLDISLDDAKSVCHSRGVCDKNTGKFVKKELEMDVCVGNGQEHH